MQEPPLDMSPISQIDRRAMLYKNLAIREVDSTMSVGTDLKISTNLKPRVIGETNLSTAKVSFGLKQLAKMAPCQGIITVAHEHGHVMEIYKNHTKHHGHSWESAVLNNMHTSAGFIRDEVAKEKGPKDGGKRCALMSTSTKQLCYFCSSKGAEWWFCLCGEGGFDSVRERVAHKMIDHTKLLGVCSSSVTRGAIVNKFCFF